MNLTSLTPELLGLILGYEEVLSSPVALWLSGNKLLQRQLALGVTEVYLENESEFALVCVPSFLKELRHLRKLAIDRSGNRILFPSSATSTIRALAPTLQKLVLDFEGATQILFPSYVEPTEDPTQHDADTDTSLSVASLGDGLPSPSSAPSSTEWSLKESFPQLVTLDLIASHWGLDMVAQLPPSLSRLMTVMQNDAEVFKAIINALPPHMEHICFDRLPMPEPDFLALIAERPLTALNWHMPHQMTDPKRIAMLPRTLTDVASHKWLKSFVQIVSPAGLTQAHIDALPPKLTTLPLITEASEPLCFSHLKELESLASDDDPGPLMSAATIKRLPPTLRSLTMTADLEGITKADWPPRLTYLEWSPKTPNFSLDSLPSHLITLLIQVPRYKVPSNMISCLPRTLQRLRCTCDLLDFNDIDFPPLLKFLNLLCEDDGRCEWVKVEIQNLGPPTPGLTPDKPLFEVFNVNLVDHLDTVLQPPKVSGCFPFHCLPPNLDDLYLPCVIPASQLKHLPMGLTTISVFDILDDYDFDRTDIRLLSRVKELNDFGLKHHGIVTPAAHASLPVSRASLLPRTLCTLELRASNLFRKCDWSRMPSTLTELVCLRSVLPIPAALFQKASFPRIRTIHVHFSGFTDENVRSMPQSLKSLSDPPYEHPWTIDCLPYWPCNASVRFPDELNAEWTILQEKRIEAIASSSIPDLRALFPNCYLNKLYND